MDEAERSVQQGLELIPGFPPFLLRQAEIHELKGENQLAIDILEPLEASGDPLIAYFLAVAYSREGRMVEVQEIYEFLVDKQAKRFIPTSVFAALSGHLGRFDEANALIEQAREELDPWVWNVSYAMGTRDNVTWDRNAFLDSLLPDNPWKVAEYDEYDVITNPEEVQAAAEARFPGLGVRE